MGVTNFQVPSHLSPAAADGLHRAYLAGGYDRSPVPTRIELAGDRLVVRRDREESGYLTVPWEIDGTSQLMGSTSTLMERPGAYRLLVELARGKINHIRSQAAEWQQGNLEISAPVEAGIRAATMALGKAVLEPNLADADRYALEALTLAYATAEDLIALYIGQLFAFRRSHPKPSEPIFCCRLPRIPENGLEEPFRRTFNSACAPLSWRTTEPSEANYQWDIADGVVDWAVSQGLKVTAGPLIDFSPRGLPDWLKTWEGDLPAIASFMCDFIETTISRYRNRIRRWVICTGSNCSLSLGLSEDDTIRLTARLAEAAWGIDPQLEVVIGLAQPWGEYLVGDCFSYSPFVFADTLLRAGLPLAGFELEFHMGAEPRGSYCRDPLDASRLLDMFGMLGSPLQVSLCYPSSVDADLHADPAVRVGSAGRWHGLTALAQSEWAETFTSLALSKGYVVGATWDHFSDAVPHNVPNGGLVDAMGNKKPSFDRLRMLREKLLRNSGDTFIA